MNMLIRMVVVLALGFVLTFLFTWRIRGRGFTEFLELFGRKTRSFQGTKEEERRP